MSHICLVTVLYHCTEVLDGFFKGLACQDINDYKLFIIDNSLDDLSFIEAKNLVEHYQLNDNVVFIKNSSNLGVAKANNQGITESLLDGAKYTLLLNNDIEWGSNNIISSLVNYAELNEVDMVVPKILFHDSKKIWAAGGNFIRYKGITKHIGEYETDYGQYDSVMNVEYSPTCFMLIKNSVFSDVGLMDERFFVYFDDTDFVWRAMIAKKTLVYYPFVSIFHKVSSSTGGYLTPFSVYQCNKNRIFFIRKNFKWSKSIVPILFFSLTRFFCFKILFNKKLRKSLFKGVVDGFSLKVKQ